jgi:hypothetical protein
MSDEAFHSELESVSTMTESTNGFGPHDDAATEPEADSEVPTADETSPDFLARLADAMRQTADAERARIGEDIDRRRAEHLAAIGTRRESEVARMRELASDDRKGIELWASQERQRIQKERDERLAAVEADLATSLDEHGKTVDAEIEQVESAISAHRAEVDSFFASLGSESDPVRIAQIAGQRPTFPDLEGATGAAPVEAPAADTSPTADAATDGEPVMAVGSDDASAEAEVPEPTAEAPVAAGSDETASEPAEPAQPAEPVTAGVDSSQATAGVPVMDPIARLGLLKAGDQAVETALPRAVPAGAWRPGTDDDPDRATAHAGSSSGGLNAIGWFRRKDESRDR